MFNCLPNHFGILSLLLSVIVISGCDAEREETPPPPPIKASSPGDQSFNDRLAAVHEKWLGTAWDFSGTSQTPKEGSIACGYFVTTTLEQSGMAVDRIRLAQAASETMIVELVKPAHVKRFSNASLDDFLTSVRNQGEGYYIVGLDNHTGFLRVSSDGDVTFIHSGPGRGVVIETPQEAPELANSRYRVTGKITGGD